MSKYNFHSYFLHVITGEMALGEALGTFYNSSDYFKCTEVILSFNNFMLIIIGDRIKEGIIIHGK